MLAVAGEPREAGRSSSRPLPLENGGLMHSREFLRRYERLPHVKKAELIEGIVYMGSPVSVRHSKPDAQGVLHSRVFPGLQLPVASRLVGDTAQVLAALMGPEPLISACQEYDHDINRAHEKAILPHPRSAQHLRARKNRIPINNLSHAQP